MLAFRELIYQNFIRLLIYCSHEYYFGLSSTYIELDPFEA